MIILYYFIIYLVIYYYVFLNDFSKNFLIFKYDFRTKKKKKKNNEKISMRVKVCTESTDSNRF